MEGDAILLKTLIGRYIAGYVNSEPLSSKYDPTLQSYVNTSGDAHGNTPLIAAAYGGHLEIVEFLVDKCGADITIKNDIGCSPIWIAAGYSKIAVLQFLINYVITEKGESKTENLADLFDENNTGDSPFLAAVSKGHVDACQVIFQTILERSTQDNGVIDYQICWRLLMHKNKAGDTPLSVVIGTGLEGTILNYLLDREEDFVLKQKLKGKEVIDRPLNTKNSKGLTPLMVACERNNVIAVKELIKRGANITEDLLTTSSFCGCLDVAEYLLSREDGLQLLNKLDSKNCSALWLAARTGNVKMVTLLVDSGADITIKGSDGLTPRAVAEKFKKDRVVDYFRQIE